MTTTDPDLARIEAAMRATDNKTVGLAMFFVGLGLFGLLTMLDRNAGVALAMFGACSVMALVMYWIARKGSPAHNPAARAVLDEPAAVTGIEQYESKSGIVKLTWLKVRARGATFGLQLPAAEVADLAKALARRCPNATVRVPGLPER